ncbi:MAG: DNA translocase FtsK, partial [Firmicutes bacterium]|nr:DNA translocase FtsK [Bacillota bacterium]
MAKKKASSQAEKIVTDTKRKAPPAKSVSKKKPPKKAAKSKNAPKVGTEYENPISSSAVTALISFCLFLLFVLICVKPEGALLMVVRSVVLGCVGRAGFYFLIPALLYTAVINLFGRKIAVRMRGTCAIAFALLCGVIYHLVVSAQVQLEPMQLLTSLYTGGAAGTSGGVLCGGAAYLLRWACGTALAYIISMLCAVLTLLGAMQITVPSLIRAIANRPRDDYEEDEEDDYIEPAAIVVNKIANRQIEQKRQRREQAKAQPVFPPEPEESAQERMPEPPRKKEKRQPAPPAAPVEPVDTVKHAPGKGADFMSRIDVEISAPLAGTSRYVHEDIPNVFDDPISEPVSVPEEPEIPQKMPELVVEHKKTVQVKPAPRKKPEPEPQPEPEPEKVTAKDTAAATKQVSAEIAQNQAKTVPEYCFPPIDLLKRPTRAAADGTEEMRENSRRLNETLASFNIDAHIINVTRGPSVTRYEVELDRGVRLNKLTGCADDIALSLGASGVRIAAVPGKISVVGIEVPNRTVTTVSLREVIDSNEFANAKSKSSVALGKSIDGACVVGNIAKMPHLLIAGTTGSGKSVCMNSIIISLLYKAGPEDIKLIMVDPKMVELGIYNGIPQLLIPVVTDPKKAAGSLQWAVTEMLRRYKMMSDLGVRDLESYNSIVVNEEDGQKLPSIVVIIDELADLMMVAAKEVEDSICRIAQMGRAAGMHLIIATQRPSANVITGLMKANIPSRIAFSVASAMESRIILDTMGAEKLVGKGDMLYAPIGSGKPLRVQGCFVTDGEVEAVAEYVKEHYVADYNQDVLDEIEKKAQQTGKKPTSVSDSEPSDEELEGDEMLPAAVDVI